jgi:hypothetical protein
MTPNGLAIGRLASPSILARIGFAAAGWPDIPGDLPGVGSLAWPGRQAGKVLESMPVHVPSQWAAWFVGGPPRGE